MAQDNLDLGKDEEQKKLKVVLKAILDEDDLYWRQWARENWLKEGDQNTKFFHASSTQKWKAKILHSITDEAGHQWESQETIGEAFVSYF